MKTIGVDNDVWNWLQQHARPFEDTPNSVLRRIAGLYAHADDEGKYARSAAQVAKPTVRRSHTKDDHTPAAQLREPILLLLLQNGGQLDRQRALHKLEVMLAARLTEADHSDINSGAIRWEKAAEWQVHRLRREGLLEPVTTWQRGVWKLTAKGKELALRLAHGSRH